MIFSRTTLAIAMLTVWALAPAAAGAQPPSAPQQVPSYAKPAPRGAETIHGTIASVSDAYHIVVRDDRGFMDFVTLQQGTIIAPRGLHLQPGMRVTIYGTNQGSSFLALDIEAPDEYGVAQSQADVYGYGIYPGYDWGPFLYDVGSSIVVVPAPANSPAPAPTPGVRRIEPPTPNMPVQRVPLADGKTVPANAQDPNATSTPDPSAAVPPAPALPSYAAWPNTGIIIGPGGWTPRAPNAPAARFVNPPASSSGDRSVPESRSATPARSAPSSSGSQPSYRAPQSEPRSAPAPPPVERSAPPPPPPAPVERSAPPPPAPAHVESHESPSKH